MQRLRIFLTATALVLFSTSLLAQAIDLGRGELPVTVPANYDAGYAGTAYRVAARLYIERSESGQIHGLQLHCRQIRFPPGRPRW